jgi:fucose permease
MIGVQMASAYVGTTFMPPIFGVLGANAGYGLFPFFLGALLILMAIMIFLLYKKASKTHEVPGR